MTAKNKRCIFTRFWKESLFIDRIKLIRGVLEKKLHWFSPPDSSLADFVSEASPLVKIFSFELVEKFEIVYNALSENQTSWIYSQLRS